MRVIVIFSYVAITAFVIFGISSLFEYLNTGADRSAMLNTEIKKEDQYLPKMTWDLTQSEGRPMDEENLKRLEDNYLDAWYVKHLAFKTNSTEGINDYYTENARKNLFDFIAHNTQENIRIESTSLSHNPKLHLYSEDGQLVVLTDHNVIEYKRIYKNEKLITAHREKTSYKVILLLEDGFWRIRHLVKEASQILENDHGSKSHPVTGIKGINYYPQATPWQMFGDSFSKDIIGKDFALIKESGLNTIRLFVPYTDFGRARVDDEKLSRLEAALDLAQQHNLKVIVTLFDFYGDYSIMDWTLTQRHAEAVVSRIKNHPALLVWDIKNEPNLDFDSRGRDAVLAWLQQMITHVRSIDPSHPITIGWSNAASAVLLKDQLDLITFHFYDDLDNLGNTINKLKELAPNKPVVLGEFGLSSYNGFWNPFGHSEQTQAEYHKKAQDILAKHQMSYLSWTLYDFTEIPKEVVGGLPWRKNAQKHFGFIDKNGAKKPSFNYIVK